jgi:uncharacterized protein YabE (DUF348 family)
MNRTLLIFLAGALALAGIFLVSQGYNKTVTLEINGHPQQVETKAWRVSSFLTEQGIALHEEDSIDPSPTAWMIGDETITIEQANWVTIFADEITTQSFTRQRNLETILSEAGIDLADGDQILLDGIPVSIKKTLSPGESHSLQVQRGQTLEVNSNGGNDSIISTAATIGEALWESGIEVSLGDDISTPLNAPLEKPVVVDLNPAQDVTIQIKNGVVNSRTAAETVGQALAEAGISLQGLDYSRPDANNPVPQDGKIQVIRVQEDLLLESEPIPYESLTQPVADLEIDNRSIVQSGIFGLNTKRIRVRYEDELEISRQVEDEYISQEPQPEIIGFGTQISPKTINTPDGPIKYWRALSMYAVSYNVTSNGGYGTATGIPLDKGVAAIDPNYIPYGTRMYVPGYGEALAADTGGGINGRMIDLGYLDENYVSWHEWVTVYFLWPPPENVVWVIP